MNDNYLTMSPFVFIFWILVVFLLGFSLAWKFM
jgi:hypothetical protein